MKAMKKLAYRTLSLVAAILVFGTASLLAQEITKDFIKTFTLNPALGVVISNRYGDVKVETWEKNEVLISVKVTVEQSSVERSEKLISLIEIEFFESDTAVGAQTKFNEKFSSINKGSGSNKFSIDYTVTLPGKTDLNISNRYGNIEMVNYPGRITIDLRYGSLAAMKLMRGNEKPLNSISISYGSGTIVEANWLSLITRYTSDLSINKIQAMTLDSRYSKTTIDEARSIVGDLKYGNLILGEVDNLSVSAGYTPIKVKKLNKTLELSTKYGSFSATEIPAGFESISVESGYTGISLGIDPAARYKVDINSRYGSLTYCEECMTVTRRIVESNSRELIAVAGDDPNPTATLKIASSYGAVRLK